MADKERIATLIEDNREFAIRWALSRGVVDRYTAEDLVQNLAIKLLRISDIREETIRELIAKAMTRLIIDSRKGRGRVRIESVESLYEVGYEPVAPDYVTERTVSAEALREVKDTVGEDTYRLFTLQASGYSQREISELLGVPLGTIKGRMRDAQIKLRSDETKIRRLNE